MTRTNVNGKRCDALNEFAKIISLGYLYDLRGPPAHDGQRIEKERRTRAERTGAQAADAGGSAGNEIRDGIISGGEFIAKQAMKIIAFILSSIHLMAADKECCDFFKFNRISGEGEENGIT